MENKILKEYVYLTEGQSNQRQIRKGRIVLLLAAGFSYNQGFPLGSDVNREIMSLTKDKYQFGVDGNLKRVINNNCYSDQDSSDVDAILKKVYNFLVDVINHYTSSLASKNDFNYEDLYDGIDYSYDVSRKFDIMNDEYRNLSNQYVDDFLTHEQIVYRLPLVLNQIISHILEESQDSSLYSDVTRQSNDYSGYANFLRYLHTKSQSNVIDVFTLNHDTLFESFKSVYGLGDKMCDGFDDFGSEYYGIIRVNSIDYRCRLERYTGRYTKPIRLYKLHGSLDYYQFYKEKKTKSNSFALPMNFIKLKRGINPISIQKGKRSRMRYDNSLLPICHADFLSGVEIKKKKYKNQFLYDKLMRHFKNKLSHADTVIIIGYSGMDEGINTFLRSCLSGTKTYIIDAKPGESIMRLKENLSATLLVGDANVKILELIPES